MANSKTTAQPTAQPAAAKAAPTPTSYTAARTANFGNGPSATQAAVLVRPTKGQNPKRALVYGYSGLAAGRVPVAAKVAVINAVALATAWPTLAAQAKAQPGGTVATLKAAGVTGRALRRAYRAGLINFTA